jgi:hypothetical protein
MNFTDLKLFEKQNLKTHNLNNSLTLRKIYVKKACFNICNVNNFIVDETLSAKT